MTDSMELALREYVRLRRRLIEIEARPECPCISEGFHCCEQCGEASELQNQVNILMRNWAEDFAVAVAINEGLVLEEFA